MEEYLFIYPFDLLLLLHHFKKQSWNRVPLIGILTCKSWRPRLLLEPNSLS